MLEYRELPYEEIDADVAVFWCKLHTDSHSMITDYPFDLYRWVQKLSQADWVEEIYIFGSRRYPSNVSFGSDIDLLIVPNRVVSIPVLRAMIDERYVDAFLLVADSTAVSSANETVIPVSRMNIREDLDAVLLWRRTGGWSTGDEYRLLRIIPDRTPVPTVAWRAVSPILLLCALQKEFEAVVKRLGNGKLQNLGDLPPQHVAYIRTGGDKKRLLVASLVGVASVSAGIATSRLLDYWQTPDLAILLGITAGLRKAGLKLRLGDVLVPTHTVDVESGKKTPKGHQRAGAIIPLSSKLLKAISTWAGAESWRESWPIPTTKKSRPPKKKVFPQVRTDCALACSASVIGYEKLAQHYRSFHRKTAGVEMEGLGVASACQDKCPLLIVKSISDWAGVSKNDRLHQYCMHSCADLVISMLEQGVL
jgi:nucleoside phosphorylase